MMKREFGAPDYSVQVKDPVKFINTFNQLKPKSLGASNSDAVLGKQKGTVDIFQAKHDNVVDFVDHILDEVNGVYC